MKIAGKFKSAIRDLYDTYSLGTAKARLENGICIHTEGFSLKEAIGIPEGSPVQDISNAIEKTYKSYGFLERAAFNLGYKRFGGICAKKWTHSIDSYS